MTRFIMALTFDDDLGVVCEALHLLRDHGWLASLEVYRSQAEVAAAAAGSDVSLPVVAVLPAPLPSPGDPASSEFPPTLREIVLAEEHVTAAVLPPTELPEQTVRQHERAGASVIQPLEDRSPWGLALGLHDLVAPLFVKEVLAVLPAGVPADLYLALGRLLEDGAAGPPRTLDKLAAVTGWVSKDLGNAFEKAGLGGFDVWQRRAAVCGAFRVRDDRGCSIEDAATVVGFETLAAFDEACRLTTGRSTHELLEAGGWLAVLDALGPKLQDDARDRGPVRPRAQGEAGQAAPPEFLKLRERFLEAALAAARDVLDWVAPPEAPVEEVFLEIYGQGLEAWRQVTRAYVLRAVRNRALNQLKKGNRVPDKVDELTYGVAPEHPGMDVDEEGRDRTAHVRQALQDLSENDPRMALITYLCDGEEVPTKRVAALLDITARYVRIIRERGREELRALLERRFSGWSG